MVASELARFEAYRSINAYEERSIKSVINACQDISVNVNMAEGPSTTATPSNQFVVKCSVHGHLVYKCIWSPCIGKQFETFCEEDNEHDKYTMAVHLKNSLTVLGHIPREITCTWQFFIKNKGDDSAAQQLVDVWKYHDC